MKKLELCFIGGSKDEFKELAIERFAVDLEMMMNGLQPLSQSKPLNGLGKGVFELKKNGRPAYRCVYVIKNQTIYVLHAFSKTANGTPKSNETTIKQRYKSIP
ncbi:type II toxin-antitoxin system RelE/ParE family toxin [Serratia marcescens]|jgi:Phage-related protein|uniref:type II toxin-antitoxin system RelE/ParE family toxin n=1 Tax=Serratia TaxID=613 RepID=UPI0018DA14B0|nr:type II toxin-antitoxin system RelE/ParE family toxin [Serratia marcescens]MBH2938173.1 type II toxin-antitoxin system RelE/ParE family toxin [Serratia marcescens]MDX6804405.1 type II toxin-antitoxin system RelE/ParE family toxin [Serratia marcescens]MDX6909188.1 type II toxin-antitoxin system RelE/ParE family toxin [Serratia marcescens]